MKNKLLFKVIRTKKDGNGTINGWAIKVNSGKPRYAGEYLDHDCIARKSEPAYAGVWTSQRKAHLFIVENYSKLVKKYNGHLLDI